MSKMYKVRIVATKTMWVSQEDIDADCNDSGWIPADSQELNEEVAISFAKGTLIEELRNNPNRGFADIMSIYDTDKKTLKTKRKYLKK